MLAWGPRYRQWIRTLTPHPAPRDTVWDEWAAHLEELDPRIDRLDQAIRTALPIHSLYSLIQALQALRGIDWLTAATLVAECGEFSPCRHPRDLMGFTGLVPMESSSGATQWRGHITKTGNGHVRRVLVESAHRDRFRPTLQRAVRRRLESLPPPWGAHLRPISWRAQVRLYGRLQRLRGHRGQAVAYTALARELCGYIWEIARWSQAIRPALADTPLSETVLANH